MSKVRREKHKILVFWLQIAKELDRVEHRYYNRSPRWRQWEKAENERIFKK